MNLLLYNFLKSLLNSKDPDSGVNLITAFPARGVEGLFTPFLCAGTRPAL
jgi:hypothetical protein